MNMRYSKAVRGAVALLMLVGALRAGAQEDAARVAQLKQLRWGMFVCWSFSTFSNKEWTPGVKDVSYFNPSGCDTDGWAAAAKSAQMGYILLLAKHHDGFCLWDTQTTDRKVTNSPLKMDVVAAVKKSCDKHGLKLALYFSEGDWTWPGAVDGKGGKGGSHPEMKKAQLKELLSNYGPIEFIWFDHAVGDGGLSHEETTRFVKSIQPGCFVGYNHGAPSGDLRLGEMGKPSALEDASGAGYGAKAAASYKGYRAAEFTFPILGKGGRWFYTTPENDKACRKAAEIFGYYQGAVKHGNLFSLDVGPDRSGKLREIDVATLGEVGGMIRKE